MKNSSKDENIKDNLKGELKESYILIGNPNVGKSVIFGILTGRYVIVSNYPGTTVEVARGEIKVNNEKAVIIDTPGVANLLPMSADEVVTRDILLSEKKPVVVQVADSKNLNRTFLITLQLVEMGIPFVLVMNMSDEARERRITIDYKLLSEKLGVDVFPTVAVSRTGTEKILPALSKAKSSNFYFSYDSFIEDAIKEIEPFLPDFSISKRSIALMVLSEDVSLKKWLNDKISQEDYRKIQAVIRRLRSMYPDPLEIVINKERMRAASALKEEVSSILETPRSGLMYELGKISMHPLWGVPILIFVLVIMYFFVGDFAAGTVVDFLQDSVFGSAEEQTGIINPFIGNILEKMMGKNALYEILVGEYGIISVGITYSIAIVLPIVAAFFLFFSLLEDSGYLPRLAITADRVCKMAGLNGKAVLPMVLGLGCGTMATISARILDTKKERLMVVLLLALGVPCSAQLGVIMGLLSRIGPLAFIIWAAVVSLSIIAVGYAAGRLLPGDTSEFILEIPPFRLPSLKNILVKTLARIEWYVKEAVPIFIIATFALYLTDKLGIMTIIQKLTGPVIHSVLGLPLEAANAFIMGFLRRDYGAIGLLDMHRHGVLSNNQVVISMITITLFLPCVAQLFIIIKERGIKEALFISAFVFSFAVAVGGFLNFLFTHLGGSL